MKVSRVFVIGGGPAGLAAAIAARLQGFEVALADLRRPPIDKACGEGIMPDGVEHLERLGVRFAPEDTFPFRGIRYIENNLVAGGRFRGSPGLGVRRTTLHEALMSRAEELGVELLWGHKVLRIESDRVLVGGRTISARWIVAADGQDSRIRRLLGLDTPSVHRRYGVRRHYRLEPWSDCVEVHWSTGCEVYVTPVGAREICVAVLTGDPHLTYDAALERFPRLARCLDGAPIQTGTLGGVSTYRRSPRVVRGNVALLGDASASVDAITGEGVTLALHQAAALARALTKEDLELYGREHARIMRLPNHMTSMMLSINRRAWLRRLALRALALLPGAFAFLLALHTRAFSKLRAGGAGSHGPGPGAGVSRDERAGGPAGACEWRPAAGLRLSRLLSLAILLPALAFTGASSLPAAQEVLRLDPAATRIEFLLDAGLHNVEGTAKLVRGEIRFDRETGEASGEFVADAKSADTDNRKRDRKMHEDVLESEAYPQVVFLPRRIEGVLPQDGESDIQIRGSFELHGAAHEVTMLAHVQMRQGQVSGTATLNVPYVAWGLEDPSVFILRVHKDVDVTLHFTGTLEPAAEKVERGLVPEEQASR